MAASRQGKESAYERRIRRYMETHPGATRQEARGHKLPAGTKSEYQRRVAGTAPGSEERAIASGKRGYSALLQGIKEGSIVGIDPVGSERNSKGQWVVVYITVLDVYGNEKRYRISGKQLDDMHIQKISDRISTAGAIASPSYPIDLMASDSEDDLDIFDFDDSYEETA